MAIAQTRPSFGYKASAEQFEPRELLNLGIRAEDSGFDSVFVSDHFQPWRPDGHAPNALPWLGALAASTERITIGTSVLTPTFRHHPALIAQAFGTLGAMFPGRVVLGVGTGESMNEAPFGIDWPEQRERFHRLKEAVGLIRQLWTEDNVTSEQQFYPVRGMTIFERPEVPVPIYIAAAGAAAARLAGRVADGLITTSGKAPTLYTDIVLPAMEEGIAVAGRDAGGVSRMIEVKVSFAADGREAIEDTRYWAALSLTPEEKMSTEGPAELQQLAQRLPIERITQRWLVATDPDEHVAQIRRYLDLGFDHLVFHSPAADQRRFLDLYGAEILPRLHQNTPT